MTGAPAQDLPSVLELLDLEQLGEDRYRSRAVYGRPYPGLYGGQVAAQALVAAGRTVDDERLPHSLHGYFLRAGDSRQPTEFQVQRDRDGGSFSARRVTAAQAGEVIFSMSASFASGRDGDPDREASQPPDLPSLDGLSTWTLPVHASFEFRPLPFEGRLPGQFWIRCTEALPEDPLTHAAVLAYISDISTGLISLEGEDSLTGASIDHSVWFHRPARMDGWVWQDLRPHTAAGGRGWYTGDIWTGDGVRVASVAQECLLRARPPGANRPGSAFRPADTLPASPPESVHAAETGVL